MKLLYIALCDISAVGELGVRNKIFSQIKSLQKKYEVYLATLNNMIFCIYKGEQLVQKRSLLCAADMYTAIEQFACTFGIKLIYQRYLKANHDLLSFLKKMKTQEIQVILEFPTFPYDKEIEGRIELEEDIVYRDSLKKYVRFCVNYNGYNSIFGIPSVALGNGVDMVSTPLAGDSHHEGLQMIAVATMNPWHGYDRMIKGMAEYYKDGPRNKKVYFTMIGSGKEIPRYRDLIQQNHLEDYVVLKGIKIDSELDREFDRMDIAVGSLGMYRISLENVSPIKSIEYCIRGLPQIHCYHDVAFEDGIGFIMRVPNNESAICIEDVITFWHRCREKYNKEEIRQYAVEHLTWDKQFEKMYQFVGL